MPLDSCCTHSVGMGIGCHGLYTIPRVDLQVSGNFQSLAGPQILANYTATNALISPSLGQF